MVALKIRVDVASVSNFLVCSFDMQNILYLNDWEMESNTIPTYM